MLRVIENLWNKYFILSLRSQRNILIFEIILFAAMVVKTKKDKQIKKNIIFYFLYSYIFWILVSTVFARIDWEIWSVNPVKLSNINWIPFYSYSIIVSGNKVHLQQVVMNCWMLFPVGFLLRCTGGQLKKFFHVRICFYLSICIEILQLIYGCGLCEFDDIIHNILGGFLGIICADLVYKIIKICKNNFSVARKNFDK